MSQSTASNEQAGRSIVLILDDVLLEPAMASRVKDIARRFVNRMLPGDEMGITTFDGETMEMTGDRTRLFNAIDDYYVRASGVRRCTRPVAGSIRLVSAPRTLPPP